MAHSTDKSHAHAEGRWSSGLCGCFSDCSTCCLTAWCPCITFGRIADIADQGSTSCITAGALYCIIMSFTGLSPCYSCFYRQKLRTTYNLKGGCGDCLTHCFCEPCALCQEYRELQHHGFDMSLGWQGNANARQNGMAPPMAHGGMNR